jgi:hypothetical protein
VERYGDAAGTLANLTEFFHDFPQSIQANAGIGLEFGYYRFLPNHFQFTIRGVKI